MRPREFYEQLIRDMPAGAERVVLRALSFHIGAGQAASKDALLAASAAAGAAFSNERQLRLTIVKLRKAGIPVCASSGDSGYFLASGYEEYREFRGREYIKKINDMRETVTAMDGSAKSMFPSEYEDFQRSRAEQSGQPAML